MEFFGAILWLFILSGHGLANEVTLYIHNKCPFPIWPATAPNAGQPVIADGGFYLASGDTARISAPWTWSGRIWARTGCHFHYSNRKHACETGDCNGQLACNGQIGTPPVTLVQFAFGHGGKPDFYDVSVVDGYNVPVFVSDSHLTPKCTIPGCNKDLKKSCPQPLQVLNDDCEVVACKSGCLAFDHDQFCCRNEYGTPETCKPSQYSEFFKDACPCYYSYAYDTPAPLVTCHSKEYVITFCPSSWGTTGAADRSSE